MTSSITLRFQTTAPVSLQEILLSVLSAVLCAAGLAALLIPVFPHIPESWPLYAVISGCLSALFCVILFFPAAKWISRAVSIFVLLIFLIRFRVFRNGTLILANDVLTFLTGHTGKIHPYFRTSGTDGTLLVPILYLILFALLCASMSRKKSRLFPVILLAVSVCSVIFAFPSSSVSTILFSAAAAVSAIRGRRTPSSVRTARSGFFFLLLPAGLSLIIAISAFAGIPLLTGNELLRTDHITESISRGLHSMRYEPRPSVLPEGDLKHFHPSVQEDVVMLRLGMTHPEKLYLRGFTADRYEDSVWGPADSSAYIENAGLFHTLHASQFFGQNMLALASAASHSAASSGPAVSDGSETENALLLVTPENACRKYQYLPYALSDNTVLDARQIGDAGAAAPRIRFGKKPDTTVLSYIPGSLPQWYETELSLAENSTSDSVTRYLRLEQAYYDYVMEQDLQLPEEAAAVCADLFGTEVKTRRLADILTLVRNTLDSGLTYDKTADPLTAGPLTEQTVSSSALTDETVTPGDSDALTAFLLTGRGSSVHFATAAAVMLRYLGVPARYVEGYFLPEEEAALYTSEDAILMTAGHAHAWAEFYLRGIGWIPFETTPGYIDNHELSLIAALTERSQSSSGASPLYTQTEILYTSGIHREASRILPTKLPKLNWNPLYLLYALLIVDVFLITFLLTFLMLRRRQFQRIIKSIQQKKSLGEYRQAIVMEFAYASLLMKACHLSAPPGLEHMSQLNEEARFSTHVFTETQMQEAENFTKTVLQTCKKTWSIKERLYFRWIRCLY